MGRTLSRAVLVAVLVVAGLVLVGPADGARAELVTSRFVASGDAYVSGLAPGENFGDWLQMRVDGSPDRRGYVRFDVSGLVGPVSSVLLRVRADSNHSTGFEVRQVTDSSWDELSITYANAPAVGVSVGASGPASAGWHSEVDLTETGLVAGDGQYTFALTALNNTNLRLSSRESENPPELVIVQDLSQDPVVTAAPSAASTVLDTPVTVDLEGTDDSGACPLIFAVDSPPVNGSLSAIGNVTCTGGLATGQVTYTPAAGHDGADSFTFTVTNPQGDTSPPATINITIGNDTFELVFTATADSYVSSDAPDTNYGAEPYMFLDLSPDQDALLRFDVTGLTHGVTSAKVRVYVESDHSKGISAWAVEDPWDEMSVTYSNAPETCCDSNEGQGSTGPVTAGSYVEWETVDYRCDHCNRIISRDGQYSFKLTSKGSDTRLRIASRESTHPPQLVIVPGPAPPLDFWGQYIEPLQVLIEWESLSSYYGIISIVMVK